MALVIARQIIAIGRGSVYRDPETLALGRSVQQQCSAAEPRIPLIPTANADPD